MATTSNPFTFRYPPNTRFITGAFKDQVEVITRVEVFGDSVTDKESYRLSLAGKRGSIGTGSTNTGWYMFPDGKYDHNKDFSYFYRKDLSIVDIDNYIENMTEAQKQADKELAKSIQEQIDIANKTKTDILNSSTNDKGTDTSSE